MWSFVSALPKRQQYAWKYIGAGSSPKTDKVLQYSKICRQYSGTGASLLYIGDMAIVILDGSTKWMLSLWLVEVCIGI